MSPSGSDSPKHNQQVKITASQDPSYFEWLPTLPWNLPLEDWPATLLAALPRGISRHTVRFIKVDHKIFAVKEIGADFAMHEYDMLQKLREAKLPVVRAAAVVTNRFDDEGNALPSAILTRHLQYSLPYRVVLSQQMSMNRLDRVVDALVVLLVRLHLAGFYWGDMSLSNTLFRRDAGEYAAYLVDAETGRFYSELSVGQREYDLDLGCTNTVGELMDLQAGDFISQDFDITIVGDRIYERYHELWNDLTSSERIRSDELWRIGARTKRLNDLGFDVDEILIDYSDPDASYLSIRPKVVEAGHYTRKVQALTGLDVEEEQAKRIDTDIATFRKRRHLEDIPLQQVALQWMYDVYIPTIQAIPEALRRKLEPAQIFHEVLEHRWYMAEKAGHHVRTKEAVKDYIANQLPSRPDEQVVLSMPLTASTPSAPYLLD